MKKLLSIFMLSIMLIVGIGPTLGMHFCGKKLHSVEVLSPQNKKSCCTKTTDSAQTNNESEIAHKDCCETHKVQIATDTYQLQERVLNIAPLVGLLQPDWFTTNYRLLLVERDTTTIAKAYFPPDGFDVKDADVLSFICILRI